MQKCNWNSKGLYYSTLERMQIKYFSSIQHGFEFLSQFLQCKVYCHQQQKTIHRTFVTDLKAFVLYSRVRGPLRSCQWDTSAPEWPLVANWGTIMWHQLAGQVYGHCLVSQRENTTTGQNISEMLRDLLSEWSIYES